LLGCPLLINYTDFLDMKNKKNNRILGLFFTEGISVKLWKEKGLLDREKLIYEELLRQKVFCKIYWFTYGVDDKKYESELKKGIEIFPMPKLFSLKKGALLYSFFLPLVYRKKLKDCCVYKTNQMLGSWSAIFSKWLYKKPVLLRTGYTMSSLLSQKGEKIKKLLFIPIEFFAYSNSDYSTVSSNFDVGYIKNKYHTKEIERNPNYINTDLFRPLNIKKKRDIIFVGRLARQKNLKELITALVDLPFSLDIYGKGEMKKELKDYAIKMSVSLNFKGLVPNELLPKILNRYKIFILPSIYEGMPKVLLEAMACGLPCIGSKISGTKEVIENNLDGILTGTDSKSIRKAILDLMVNKKLRDSLSRNARKKILNEYSIEKVVFKEVEIYNKFFNKS